MKKRSIKLRKSLSRMKKRSRKSLKKRSGKSLSRMKKRSRKYLYDGMDKPEDATTSKRVIKLENYIDDIMLFYQKPFNDTISSFKMFKYNNKHNDTFEFIKELFNFHRDRDVNDYYHNKSSILGLVIISGLYDEFENLIDRVKTIKRGGVSESKSPDDEIVDCDTRRNDKFKGILAQHKKSLNTEQQKYLNEILKINIDSFVKKIRIDKKTKFIDADADINDEIKKFLYYSVCIEESVRRHIMRHYLLHFIKSEKFLEYDKVITLDTSSTDKNKKTLINKFLIVLDSGFKPLRDMRIEYVKKDGLIYNFNTCGETTILNLLNYYFIKEDGTFNIKDTYSVELKDFYKKYDTITKQLEDQRQTNKDWLNVVSNLEKEDKKVRLYNTSGDIHNNISNINFILKKILNSEKHNIIKILKSVNDKYTIDIEREDEDSIEFILDNDLKIFFKPGHGEMKYKTYVKKKINLSNSDFYILYKLIFSEMEGKDRETFIIEKFEDSIETWDGGLQDILKEFFKFSIISYTIYGNRSDEEYKNYTIIQHLNKLENLQTLIIEGGDTKDDLKLDNVFKLKSIKSLTFSDNKMTILPEEISKLINLKELVITYNKLEKLPENIDKLRKLRRLNLFNNRIVTLPTTIGNLSNLKELNLNMNKLINLPDSIVNLKNLEKLLLMINELPKLPENIGNLSNLKELFLSKNKLTTIPNSICMLKKLERIDFDTDKIKTPPDCLSKYF